MDDISVKMVSVKMWVMYTCHQCGTTDRLVEVRERDVKVEQVVPWVEYAVGECGADHLKQSPWCPSRQIDMKIPVAAGSSHIGEVTRQ